MFRSIARRVRQLIATPLAARLLLWCGLFAPTLLALYRSGGGDRIWQSLLWAAAASAIPATLPRRAFVASQWLALAALPAFLWWIGYAALNGAGPGWEAAMAAISTNRGEVVEAARLVARTPGFAEFAAISTLCFLASIAALLPARSRANDAPATATRPTILAGVLALFAASNVGAATGIEWLVPFQLSDATFSPLGTACRLANGVIDRAMYGELLDAPGQRRPAEVSHQAEGSSLALFVIGESVRAGGIGPLEVARGPWTRALDDRVRSGLGAWLPTTCAGSNGTHISVPLLLTGISPEHRADAATAPSALAVLKAAGFATAWLSAQDPAVFKEEGHDLYWSRSRTTSISGAYDGDMVPIAAAFVAPLMTTAGAAEKPRAVIVHMMGSHFEYQDHYPASLFPDEPAGLTQDALTALRYARSLEYTAKVLSELAGLLDRTSVPAFLVFTGDHGENLPGDHNGLNTHLGSRASVHDGTTASFVLWNRAMAATGRPKALAPLAVAPMIAHADVTHAFLVLAGMAEPPITVHPDPTILAPLVPGGPTQAAICSRLKP